jgi:hypothetical protein
MRRCFSPQRPLHATSPLICGGFLLLRHCARSSLLALAQTTTLHTTVVTGLIRRLAPGHLVNHDFSCAAAAPHATVGAALAPKEW